MAQKKKLANPKPAFTKPSLSQKNVTIGSQNIGMLISLLLVIAILPLLFSSQTYDVNVTTRFTFLAVFVSLFLLYFFIIRTNKTNFQWPLLPKLVFAFGVLYGLWNIVPMLLAINKEEAYFIIGRHFLSLLFLLIVIVTMLETQNKYIYIARLLSVTALLHSIIGITQFYEIGFEEIQGNSARPIGLMANRNFFGSAQMLLLPFAMYSFFKDRSIWRFISGTAFCMLLFSVIISQTRSAWIAAFAVIIFSLLLVLISIPELRKKWTIGTLIVFGIAALLFLLASNTSADMSFSQSLKDKMSLSISQDDVVLEASSANERLVMWDMTLKTIKDNPIVGVGGGNWKFNVLNHVTTESPYTKGKIVPMFAHNEYLQITTESGIVGIILFLAMWLLVFLIALKNSFQLKTTDQKVLSILMLCGLLGFAVDSTFSFPTQRMEHTVYLLLFAGIVISQYIKNQQVANEGNTNRKWAFALLLPFAIGITILGFYRFAFEKHFVLARANYNNKDFDNCIKEVELGKNSLVSVAPNGVPIEMYYGLALKEQKKYTEALQKFDESLKMNPKSMALYVNKGTIYTELKQYDTAISFYNKAFTFAPTSTLASANLAINYFNIKKYKECLEMIKKANLPDDKNMQSLQAAATQALATEQNQTNMPK